MMLGPANAFRRMRMQAFSCSRFSFALALRKPHAVLVAGERKEGSRPHNFCIGSPQVGRRGRIGNPHVKPVWSISLSL